MKKVIIFTFTFFFIVACSTNNNKADEHFNKAKKLFKIDDVKNASSEIEKAILLDSSNLDFQILKAKIIRETDNYQQSISILTKLLNRSIKLDTLNFELASTYFDYGNYFAMKQNDNEKAIESLEKSLTYFNEAINNNFKYYHAYLGKQKVLHNLGRYDEALNVLSTAINLYPDSMALILGRGVEKLYLGDLAASMIDLNKSIESNKLDFNNLASAYRFRANLYQKKENTDQAISDLTQAIKSDPKDEFAFAARGECYRIKGLKNKACEDFRKSADLGLTIIYEVISEYCN